MLFQSNDYVTSSFHFKEDIDALTADILTAISGRQSDRADYPLLVLEFPLVIYEWLVEVDSFGDVFCITITDSFSGKTHMKYIHACISAVKIS